MDPKKLFFLPLRASVVSPLSRFYFIFLLFWAAPQFQFCSSSWGKSISTAHLFAYWPSLSTLKFVTSFVWSRCIFKTNFMYYGIGTHSRFLFFTALLRGLFFPSWGSEPLFLFAFETTWQTSRNGIILFCDGLNIGGHLPSAVKKALAAAAAFSHTVWIKPKSWGALSVRLAFPPIITAKKTRHFIKW